MSDEKRDLPDFASPPVMEVALSVQFQELSGLSMPHLGVLRAHLQDRFPIIEEHSPLAPLVETFDMPTSDDSSTDLATSDLPSLGRYWFISESRDVLIQVQRDRFIHNWRKTGTDDKYPRYGSIRETFAEELEKFTVFLRGEDLGELRPEQCDITYVNIIESGEIWKTHGALEKVLTVFRSEYSDDFLSEPEDASLSLRYVIPGTDGNPEGRLHIQLNPVFELKTGKPAFLLKLTARGAPKGHATSDILDFFDIGREWIVRGFTSITTREMHKLWGLNDGS